MGTTNDFIEIHKTTMETLGFWTEEYRSVITRTIEQRYKTDILREMTVSDFVIHGDKVLVKWIKRHRPLTNEELKDVYGRTDV